MESKKIPYLILLIICTVYVVSPDPLPFVVDDVIMGLLGFGAIKQLRKGDEK